MLSIFIELIDFIGTKGLCLFTGSKTSENGQIYTKGRFLKDNQDQWSEILMLILMGEEVLKSGVWPAPKSNLICPNKLTSEVHDKSRKIDVRLSICMY